MKNQILKLFFIGSLWVVPQFAAAESSPTISSWVRTTTTYYCNTIRERIDELWVQQIVADAYYQAHNDYDTTDYDHDLCLAAADICNSISNTISTMETFFSDFCGGDEPIRNMPTKFCL